MVLSVFFQLSGIVPAHAQVPEFFGDFCWSFSVDGTSGILNLGVTDMGNQHFLVNGLFITTSPFFAQSTINGNAEPLSDGIYVTLTRSGFDGDGITYSVINMFLDFGTLNGSFDESLTFANNGTNVSGVVTTFRSGDVFSLVSCE
jgi:hypothetical protein